ncbi:MAG: hypothetical protein QGH45_07730 [Myxococcota bacterium]|jgi:hypothetical protein|nr:hypothetical protein [Myxococcota bacterium]
MGDGSRILCAAAALVALVALRPSTVDARGWDWAGTASFTALTGEGFPEGEVENDIQVDVIHLKLIAEPTDFFHLSIAPCLAHPGMGFMLMHAFVGLTGPHPMLNLEVGQVIVPFGRINYLSEPGNQPVRSRPFIFEDLCTPDLFHRRGFPAPIAASTWTTLGALYYGSLWPGDYTQIWLAAWAGNGLSGIGDVEWRRRGGQYVDNNDSKSYGARLVFTQEVVPASGPAAMFSFGGSFTGGKYDDFDELYDWVAGADVQIDIGQLTIQAEYVHRSTNFRATSAADSAETVFDNYRTDGFYAHVHQRLPGKLSFLSLFARIEGMWRTGPEWVGSAQTSLDPDALDDRVNRMLRYTVGFPIQLNAWITLKPEFWFTDYEHDVKGELVALEILEDDDRDVYRLALGLDVAF